MWHTQILERRQRTDRCRYQIISDEKKGTDNGDDFAAMPHARINAAAVGIEPANDYVIDADESGKHAHRGDEPERCITGNRKRETDDVGFACAPVPVENRSRARHVDIARPPDIGWDHAALRRGFSMNQVQNGGSTGSRAVDLKHLVSAERKSARGGNASLAGRATSCRDSSRPVDMNTIRVAFIPKCSLRANGYR